MPSPYVGWIAGELCADCVVDGQWQQAYTNALKAVAARDPTILSLGGAARWYEIAALLWGGSADQAREEVRRFGEAMNNNRRRAPARSEKYVWFQSDHPAIPRWE